MYGLIVMGLNDRRPLRIGETQVLQIGNSCSWGRSDPLCGTPTGDCGSPCGKTVWGIRFVFLLYKVPVSATVAPHSRVLCSLHGRMSSGPPQPYFVEMLRRGDNTAVRGYGFQSAPRVGRNAKGVVSAVWYMLVLICIPGWEYNHSIYHFAADCNILRLFSVSCTLRYSLRMGKIFGDGRAVSDGVLQLGISRVQGICSKPAASPVYGKSRLCFFRTIRSRGGIPLRVGKTDQIAASGESVLRYSSACGKNPFRDVFCFPVRGFPLQRPLPCIARSCIVSTGVWVWTNLCPTVSKILRRGDNTAV